MTNNVDNADYGLYIEDSNYCSLLGNITYRCGSGDALVYNVGTGTGTYIANNKDY